MGLTDEIGSFRKMDHVQVALCYYIIMVLGYNHVWLKDGLVATVTV